LRLYRGACPVTNFAMTRSAYKFGSGVEGVL